MPRDMTSREAAFMADLQRVLKRQPSTCAVYFTPSGAHLHDVSEASAQFESSQSIEVANYSGVTDCGDY